MTKCMIIDAKNSVDLSSKINEWLKSMSDKPIYNLNFHYSMGFMRRSVLITWCTDEVEPTECEAG